MSFSNPNNINSGAQCDRCKLHPRFCLCPHLQPLTLRTRVEVVIHQRETVRSSNTAQLVPLTLTESALHIHGLPPPDHELDLSSLADPARAVFVLFPSDDSLPLDQAAAQAAQENRPITLVAIDGSWRQARRMSKRIDTLRKLPWVTLPPQENPSRYAQRRQTDLAHLSTFEAIARALGLLEGVHVQDALEKIFDLKVRADMAMRGRLEHSPALRATPLARDA
jgi:DTW domain-containing protein YfiP